MLALCIGWVQDSSAVVAHHAGLCRAWQHWRGAACCCVAAVVELLGRKHTQCLTEHSA
jgi:hypothetical protein